MRSPQPYYAPGGGMLHNLGQAADQIGQPAPLAPSGPTVSGVTTIMALLVFAASGLATYHGYRRSGGSLVAAVGWGIFGLLLPPVAVVAAVAQGYAVRAPVRRNRRRRRR